VSDTASVVASDYPPSANNLLLAEYKARAAPDPTRAAIEITRREQRLGLLVPALTPLAIADLESLSAWRNLHRSAFFSERASSAASTARWLDAIATRGDRLLFLITAGSDRIVGHIGLNDVDEAGGTAETDAWLGVGDRQAPGIMLFGFAALLRWAFGHLGLRFVDAQVFSDNTRVIRAHEMLGFHSEGQVPFARHEDAGGVWWAPGDAGVVRLVSRLRVDSAAFDARSPDWR
jgi:RimJ/RimL family protein N-acetyltransferase